MYICSYTTLILHCLYILGTVSLQRGSSYLGNLALKSLKTSALGNSAGKCTSLTALTLNLNHSFGEYCKTSCKPLGYITKEAILIQYIRHNLMHAQSKSKGCNIHHRLMIMCVLIHGQIKRGIWRHGWEKLDFHPTPSIWDWSRGDSRSSSLSV